MKKKAIIIGGSAGSYKEIIKLISSLPKNLGFPIFICLHRLRTARTGFSETLKMHSPFPIIEPVNDTRIELNTIYVAPANYHMYILNNERIYLSVEEELNHSRPSIDISFQSAAEVYGENLMGIILSGANNDGAFGLLEIKNRGGFTVAQLPEDCDISVMPQACIDNKSVCKIQSVKEMMRTIQDFI
jgi:two-component system chemotaxis response regulator CheB